MQSDSRKSFPSKVNIIRILTVAENNKHKKIAPGLYSIDTKPYCGELCQLKEDKRYTLVGQMLVGHTLTGFWHHTMKTHSSASQCAD